ncbi:hypothetical protein [Anaerocolumna xylanovorans]|uniref:Uncharacterized protein n=1 Tax=Anaerocolumna xylanovorans DSM 12503 TaxID=1121345 RepID=A0A1M7YFP0_9FIRM|nr:hypothetical protein [Anaerocolumna xylanovorans]SHO51379.1 hypothetical protein SAMN02745217_03157 [Anaerocolumna xylanovorans DSM 12503]
MKRVKIMMTLLIPALLFSACNGADRSSTASDPSALQSMLTEQIPDDFGFTYIHNFIEVDTFNSTIKNTYYFSEGDPDAITDFSFSHEQLEKIYEAFIQYDIQDLPEEIDPDKGFMSIPPSYYELLYISDGETKNISCRTGADIDQEGISEDNNNFVKFMAEVWNYVYESDAYQRLPSGPETE